MWSSSHRRYGGPAGKPASAEAGAYLFTLSLRRRTYRVEGHVYEWNVHALNSKREKVGICTDELTGDEIFVTWSEIAVVRLVKSG